MTGLLTKNLGWKLLSMLLAIALWFAVAREPELATSISVPIEFKSIPDDLDISSGVPDRVHVEMRGPSGRLSRDYLSDLAVVLDLSDVRPGERTFTIRERNINLPVGVAFYRAVPSQITLRFDRLITREVKIVPRYSKAPPEGYRIKSFQLDPTRVRIRGPEDHVRQIEQVMTDPVDVSSVVGEAEFHVHINIGDPQVRLDSAVPFVTVRVVLAKTPSRTEKDGA